MAFNLLGNVAQNPIDEIFYEKRGLPVEVVTADGDTEVLRGLERTKLAATQKSIGSTIGSRLKATIERDNITKDEGDFFDRSEKRITDPISISTMERHLLVFNSRVGRN